MNRFLTAQLETTICTWPVESFVIYIGIPYLRLVWKIIFIQLKNETTIFIQLKKETTIEMLGAI